jgi:hypothetical protein
VYDKIIPAPDLEFVRLVVERGLGDWLGSHGGTDFVGYPKQSRISDSVSATVHRDGAPIISGDTPEGAVSHGEHGATWWSGLDPAIKGEEWTTTAESAMTAYMKLKHELLKRPEPERRFIYVARWENGIPVEIEQP